MNERPNFVQEHLPQALKLAPTLAPPHFSRGTYQFEVTALKKKYFPFLQVNDEGHLTDFFCTCKESESAKGCLHLAAAYLCVFDSQNVPLHVRYRHSFWYHLLQIMAQRLGYSTDCLKKESEKTFFAESKTKKRLFFIEAKTAPAKKQLYIYIVNRKIETEETSIKFSNLSLEEIENYRAGQGSQELLFELSFWSDLAKWLFFLSENKNYQIHFQNQPLPNEISIDFPELHIFTYIADANFPFLIPSLNTVQSPLQVFEEGRGSLANVTYDEQEGILRVIHQEKGGAENEVGTPIGNWLYIEGKGFYPKSDDPIFTQNRIEKDQIAEVLSRVSHILKDFLPISSEKRKCQYTLFFDESENLHIELFVLTPGDMHSPQSRTFVPWTYVAGKGFFLLEDWLFEGKEKIVPKSEMAEFINRHRVWLHHFPGFQTHLGSLESYLTFDLTPEHNLVFEAKLNFPESYEKTHHFDEWVYIAGEGFYLKKGPQGQLPIHPGLSIPRKDISHFIEHHKEDLEQVRGFYNPESPIVKKGLHIFMNENGLITVAVKMEYAPHVDPSQLLYFGNYVYIPEKGFSEIPLSSRLPERFRENVTIPISQEAPFLAYELEALKPYALEIDPRLVKNDLQLVLRKIVPNRKRKAKEWLVDLYYQSASGRIDVFAIWDAMQEKKRHLFSPAGLIFLKDPRFNWIRQLRAKKLDRKREMIRLSTLEWIRLTVFESIEEPQGEEALSQETKQLLTEISKFEPGRVLDISRLKAKLRPYQEQGLHWLWFLYCHGLSGLLCDDMGLGKTHQAMALLAAVIEENKEEKKKYFVVCPTSVIYHWQDLLKRFLPEIRICTYYGLERTLADFEQNYDLLITSYGILRMEEKGMESLRSQGFEVAIFDEIQIAKNQQSQTHKALSNIKAQMKLGLSGTPIENRLRELKSLFDVVLPSYLPPDPIFREMFVLPIEKRQDNDAKTFLSKLVKPFILRRRKSEVLKELPEKIEEIAHADLSETQKSLYRDIALQMRDTIYRDLKDTSKSVPFIHVFSALSKLKQICNHPALFLEDPKHYYKYESGKWDLFVELLHEARESGQKVVVFSQYLNMLLIIESYLKKKGIGFATIKGSTRDRPEQLARFREDPRCEVFVASLLAAGVGIDLTVASIVIHYDRWWNPAKENQATDRVHRIGQNRGVQVFKLVTKNTIEEHIHDMIERKKGLLEDIIGAEDQITYLSRDELIKVFEKLFHSTL